MARARKDLSPQVGAFTSIDELQPGHIRPKQFVKTIVYIREVEKIQQKSPPTQWAGRLFICTLYKLLFVLFALLFNILS